MPGKEDKKNSGGSVLAGGLAVIAGGIVATLLTNKPAEAAPPEERWDYLIECQEAIAMLLGNLITAVEGLSLAVSVKTPWVARDPEHIYSHDIRVAGTFQSDKMVDLTEGKRLVIVVQSSLNQAIIVQPIGNFVDDMNLAAEINGPINVAADENHTIGFAWDDWHPFVGVRITTAIAPTAGILNIWAVVQE